MAELRNGVIIAAVSSVLGVGGGLLLYRVNNSHAASEKQMADLKDFRDLTRVLNSEITKSEYDAFEHDVMKLRADVQTGKYRELLPINDPNWISCRSLAQPR